MIFMYLNIVFSFLGRFGCELYRVRLGQGCGWSVPRGRFQRAPGRCLPGQGGGLAGGRGGADRERAHHRAQPRRARCRHWRTLRHQGEGALHHRLVTL